MSGNELLQEVLDTREAAHKASEVEKVAKMKKRQAEEKLIEYLDEKGMKGFKSAVLNCAVTRTEQLYASVVPDNKEEALRWIEEDCGRGDIIKRSVHPKTLSSFIGGMIKECTPIPSELIKNYFRPELSVRMDG